MKAYVLYSIAAMLFLGAGSFVRKLGTTSPKVAFSYTALEGLALLIVGGAAALLTRNRELPPLAYPVVSGLLIAFALIFFFTALASGPVSVVNTILGANLVVTVLLGVLLLGESLSIFQASGVLLIVLGLFLLQI